MSPAPSTQEVNKHDRNKKTSSRYVSVLCKNVLSHVPAEAHFNTLGGKEA